jgi:hypothetical protein
MAATKAFKIGYHNSYSVFISCFYCSNFNLFNQPSSLDILDIPTSKATTVATIGELFEEFEFDSR